MELIGDANVTLEETREENNKRRKRFFGFLDVLSRRNAISSQSAPQANRVNALPPARPTNSEGPITICEGGSNPDLDIIFVHGLMGDPYKTWEKDGVFWPKQLLGAVLPNARIITYGYDADVVRLFSAVSTNTIFAHSRGLIKAIHRSVSGQADKRPIMFVAHSLGGILVKDGLHWAKEQRDYSNVYEVFRRTKGILFLGTPHRGAYGGYADFGKLLQRLTSIFLHENNHHLLSSLKSDSETLERLSESFARMLNDRSFIVHSFVEELPMTNIKGIGLVVDKNSGYIGVPQEEKDTIHADHLGMVKFASTQDPGYVKVLGAIQDCYKTIKQNEEGPEEALVCR